MPKPDRRRNRQTCVRVRPGANGWWNVFRADRLIVCSILKQELTMEFDSVTFLDRLLPIIEEALRVKSIKLLVKEGKVDLPLRYKRISAQDLNLEE